MMTITESSNEINYKTLFKMIFIYNAVNKGWSVKKLDNNMFEFKKRNDQLLRNCLLRFIQYNFNLDQLRN